MTRRRIGRGCVVAAVLAALGIGLLPLPARAQSGTLYIFTVKSGQADAAGSGDTLFDALERDHGAQGDDRAVAPLSLELDIYGVTRSSVGLGLGVEVLGYSTAKVFPDGFKSTMVVKGVLFTLKTFLRFESFMPFIGVGIGNYYLNYSETTMLSLRDSPDEVYNARAGVRLLFGRLGVLFEGGQTHARLDVPSTSGRQSLELGGTYSNVGLSWIF